MSAMAASQKGSRPGSLAQQRTAVVPLLLLVPLTIYMVVFLLWPMARIALMSFYTADPTQLFVEMFHIGNYQKLFADPFHANILIRTFRVALTTTLVAILLSYPVAYFLARTRSRWRGLFVLMVFFPLLVSVIIRCYGWMVLLGDEGLVNTIWKSVSFSNQSLPLMFKEYSVVIGLSQVVLPYMVIPLMSAIQNIDPKQEEAAIGLGAGPLTV
ncbi:MAG: ABC transporter permease, partial [Deltaproteobacteria bacterium]|nr:ABC transporter permease [Deltaproteobacteria bacterium]